MSEYLFTSESVTEGHPDKICDQVSDGMLDAILSEDPEARVDCETLAFSNRLILAGEITTRSRIDYAATARRIVGEIGYTRPEFGFDVGSLDIQVCFRQQSTEIAAKVSHSADRQAQLGAGDQGMATGFACNETPELMPLPIQLAHGLARRLAQARKAGILPYLRPDGKTQVTVRYRDGKPAGVDTIVISAQHDENVILDKLREEIRGQVISSAIPSHLLNSSTRYHINPGGSFIQGGPAADTGFTGRKIIVDTYGGYARHGGGCFSGKDPTKVDRSGAYMARFIAKNIVAAGLADKAELQIGYVIGYAEPVSVMVETFGTGRLPDERLLKLVLNHFDLSPGGIIERFNLRRPIYRPLAAYGHFGRNDLDLPWERLDAVDQLKGLI